jgi:hypothetical protein
VDNISEQPRAKRTMGTIAARRSYRCSSKLIAISQGPCEPKSAILEPRPTKYAADTLFTYQPSEIPVALDPALADNFSVAVDQVEFT